MTEIYDQQAKVDDLQRQIRRMNISRRAACYLLEMCNEESLTHAEKRGVIKIVISYLRRSNVHLFQPVPLPDREIQGVIEEAASHNNPLNKYDEGEYD